LQHRNRGDQPYAAGPLDVLAGPIWRHANALPCPDRTERLEMIL
jgi:hypothetical protein